MNLVDLLIMVLVVAAAARGVRAGIVRQACSLIGLWAGLYAGSWIALRWWHAPAGPSWSLIALSSVLLGMAVGAAAGDLAGLVLFRAVRTLRLRWLDAILGGAAGGLTALLTVWLLSFLVAGLTGPLSAAVRGSAIVRKLDAALPPLSGVVASLERTLAATAFPRVFSGLAPAPTSPVEEATNADVLQAIAADRASVVKIEGEACGEISEGSGFVVAGGAVVTNAHVVAGVRAPVVEDGAGTHAATVIWYDPDTDLAVLRVAGLAGEPLSFDTDPQSRGTQAAALGYPNGGGFSGVPAGVLREIVAEGRDIYDTHATERHVYEVQSPIEPGNSGGPLVLPDGRVIGIVFAKSQSDAETGYVLTAAEVAGKVAAGVAHGQEVGTGGCLAL